MTPSTFSTIAITACVLASSSLAQNDPSTRLVPIQAAVRDAGTLHLPTHTWTRRSQAADIGADVIYDNTCFTGLALPLDGDRVIDEGRLPSTTSPSSATSRPGCANVYTIDGFEIGYCTDQIGFSASTVTVTFNQSHVPCATFVGTTPTASFPITGLPGTSTGAQVCWLVTLDLDAPPQSASLAFTMLADGDGTYAAPESSNLFAWSFECSLPDAQQSGTGPIFAGDPSVCSRWDGTLWDSPVNYAEQGTGMGTLDQFRLESGTSPAGCYLGSGNPFLSFHLQLFSDPCESPLQPVQFCFGDGTGTACPCGNSSPVGANVGCLNSLGVGARLRTTGLQSLSNDTLVLVGDQMPATGSCLYFQGTNRAGTPPGNGTMFGDGKRCAGGSVIRLGTKTNAAGASQYPAAGDLSISVRGAVTTPGTVRTYQTWYRNAASFCTTSTFNLSNGIEATWGG